MLPTSAYTKLGINNGLIPDEGPKAIPILVDCRASTSVLIDLSHQNDMKQLSFVQCLFVDNSQNNSPLTIAVQTSNQPIVVPAQSQGYFPVVSPMPNKFIFNTNGAVQIYALFMNVPMPLQIWGANNPNPPFLFNGSNGGLVVSDPLLENLIGDLGGGLGLGVNVLTGGGGGGGAAGLPLRYASATSFGISGFVIMATTPVQKFRISGMKMTINPNAVNASTNGNFEWTLYQGTPGGGSTVDIAKGSFYIPATVPIRFSSDAAADVLIWEAPPGLLYTSSLVGDDLMINSANGFDGWGAKVNFYVNGEVF